MCRLELLLIWSRPTSLVSLIPDGWRVLFQTERVFVVVSGRFSSETWVTSRSSAARASGDVLSPLGLFWRPLKLCWELKDEWHLNMKLSFQLLQLSPRCFAADFLFLQSSGDGGHPAQPECQPAVSQGWLQFHTFGWYLGEKNTGITRVNRLLPRETVNFCKTFQWQFSE